MALTDYDKKNLSSSDQKKIQAATDKWNAANAKGDTKGMAAAAAEAAAVRNNAGYRTDDSGNYAGSYTKPTSTTTSSGGSSGSSGATYSPYTQYTPTGSHNDQGVSQWAQNQINNYKTLYTQAMANGNTELANFYHNEAEKIRANYGYSGGEDGSEYIKLPEEIKPSPLPSPSGSSSFDYFGAQPTAPQQDPRIEEMLNEILNRDDFSYDVENDPLYQQYAQMYQREGDRAMRDTMAEAAASAGGMNSYAMTAAQQANNYYGAQLNDKIPELYQLAYDMYLADKESKVQDLGILQSLDDTQYNRYRDTMADWKDDRNFAYGMYQDDIANEQWNKTFDYNKFVDDRNFAYDSDWANKEWNYNVEQDTLKNNRYDKETAKEEVWKLIELGVDASQIDPELIKKADMDETTVALAVAAVKAEQTKKGKSGTVKVEEEVEPKDDFMSVGGLGLGPITDALLLNLIEQGVVIMNEEGKVKWADGYGKHNYRDALLQTSYGKSSFLS